MATIIIIALASLIVLTMAISIVLLLRIERIRHDAYLTGRMDQKEWDRITEISPAIGGILDDPLQLFAQQIAEARIVLDLHRLDLPDWDGHDRLGAFSEM